MPEKWNQQRATPMGRRSVITAGVGSIALASLGSLGPSESAEEPSARIPRVPGIKALTFDVFGTVVDWRSSIIREGQLLQTGRAFASIGRSSQTPGEPAMVR